MDSKNNTAIAIITSILTVIGMVAAMPQAQNLVSTSLASHPVISVAIVGVLKIVFTLFNPNKTV